MKEQCASKWYFSSDAAGKELGDSPLDLLADAEMIKSNAVRKVFRSGKYFIKFDRRATGGFRSEFQAAQLCRKSGVPAVEHLAWGRTPEGFFLITRAAEGFIETARWLKTRQEWQVYTAVADFLGLILGSGLFHPDLHLGNVLVNPENREIKLVDLHGIRNKNFFDRFRSYMMQRAVMEMRDHVSDSGMLELIERCGIRNGRAFFSGALMREAVLLRKSFPKRKRQVLSGYPKFTRMEPDGTLTDIAASAEDLAKAEIIRLPEAETLFLFHFFLDLAHIPHRRVLSFDRKNQTVRLEGEIAAGRRSAASAEELQNRLCFNGVKSRPEDFGEGFLYDIPGVCQLNF
ncbi:MAG: hypothetical protein IKA87_09775 [Lentisphaeria bacterium]|nr:hypothetical protein [Lentisphaeria bacterium]